MLFQTKRIFRNLVYPFLMASLIMFSSACSGNGSNDKSRKSKAKEEFKFNSVKVAVSIKGKYGKSNESKEFDIVSLYTKEDGNPESQIPCVYENGVWKANFRGEGKYEILEMELTMKIDIDKKKIEKAKCYIREYSKEEVAAQKGSLGFAQLHDYSCSFEVENLSINYMDRAYTDPQSTDKLKNLKYSLKERTIYNDERGTIADEYKFNELERTYFQVNFENKK